MGRWLEGEIISSFNKKPFVFVRAEGIESDVFLLREIARRSGVPQKQLVIGRKVRIKTRRCKKSGRPQVAHIRLLEARAT